MRRIYFDMGRNRVVPPIGFEPVRPMGVEFEADLAVLQVRHDRTVNLVLRSMLVVTSVRVGFSEGERSIARGGVGTGAE